MDPLSFLPSIGSLGAAAIQRNWALKDWNRVNAYNTPKEQVKRLREAGLPLATMFGGQGGSTASPVDTTQVDPTLGTARGLEAHFTNRMQRKQLELMDQDLRVKTAEADIKEGERNWKLSMTPDLLYGSQPGIDTSNLEQTLNIQKETANFQRLYEGAKNQIEQVAMRVQEMLEKEGVLAEKQRQEIKNMIVNMNLSNITAGDHALELKLKKQMFDRFINDKGFGSELKPWIFQFLRRWVLR